MVATAGTDRQVPATAGSGTVRVLRTVHDQTRTPLRRILVTVDVVAFAAAWTLVVALTDGITLGRTALAVVVGVATGLALNAIQSLFTTNVNARGDVVRQRIARASLCSAVAVYLVLPADLSAPLLVCALGATAAFIAASFGRLCFNAWLDRCRVAGRYLRPVVVVGRGPDVRELFALLDRAPGLGVQVCGVVGDDPEAGGGHAPWLGLAADVSAAVAETGATGAIVMVNGLASDDLRSLLADLERSKVHVLLSHGLLGVEYRRLQPMPLAHEPFVYVQRQRPSRVHLGAKRALDIVLSLGALVLTAPVLLIAAIAIKLEDGGPVLFRQRRVGQEGRQFLVHKLRTMIVDAEERLGDVRHLNEREGPLFKISDDPRETRVGRFLRQSSIDELPQLLDVLLGHMSLVGPRPALPCEAELFDDALRQRVRVRPGITGMWQLESRDEASFESFRRLDLFYVDNWSLGLDVAILAGTIPVVIGRCMRPLSRLTRVRSDRERVGEVLLAAETAEVAS